ncbi:putative reverse transcriptase zinc-binding domain-containing protein [Helianthus anomalus]
MLGMPWIGVNGPPSKCNLLARRAEMDRIPTYDALIKRGVAIDEGLCVFCKSEVESVEHIFTSCWFSSVLWLKRPIGDSQSGAYQIRGETGCPRYHHRFIVSCWCWCWCWCLWMARNRAVFSSKEAMVDDVFSEVKSLGFLWFKHRTRINHISWLDWCNFNML